MDGGNLVFDEDYRWDGSLRAVRLCADHGKQRLCFAFDGAAINDHFRTEDSRDAAMRNFEVNRPWFEGLVTNIVDGGYPPDEHGNYFIVTTTIQRHAP